MTATKSDGTHKGKPHTYPTLGEEMRKAAAAKKVEAPPPEEPPAPVEPPPAPDVAPPPEHFPDLPPVDLNAKPGAPAAKPPQDPKVEIDPDDFAQRVCEFVAESREACKALGIPAVPNFIIGAVVYPAARRQAVVIGKELAKRGVSLEEYDIYAMGIPCLYAVGARVAWGVKGYLAVEEKPAAKPTTPPAAKKVEEKPAAKPTTPPAEEPPPADRPPPVPGPGHYQ